MPPEVLFPPFKSVFLQDSFEHEFDFVVPFKTIQSQLTFSPQNVPVLVMLNQASGALLYSFGFDFSRTTPEKIFCNKGEPEKLESVLVRKSFVHGQSKVVVNIKNIFGLRNTMKDSSTE